MSPVIHDTAGSRAVRLILKAVRLGHRQRVTESDVPEGELRPSHPWVKKAFYEVFETSVGRRLSLIDRNRLLKATYERMKQEDQGYLPVTNIEILVTENCNLRCDYCFMENKTPRTMTEETGIAAVDFLLNNSGDAKDLGILFFGGEPLLRFPIIRAIVDYADGKLKDTDRHITYYMTTNGILFTQESLAFCREHRFAMLLSIDGTPETHDAHRRTPNGEGSHALVMDKLPLIFQHLGNIAVRVTPYPDVVHRLVKGLEYLLERGFRDFTIGAAHGVRWSKEHLAIYEEQMERIIEMAFEGEGPFPWFRINPISGPTVECGWGCRAGRSYVAVGADGRIGPCSLIMGTPRLGDQYVFGDLWSGITEPLLRTEFMVLDRHRTERCTKCDIARYCGGGCPGVNFKMQGSIIQPSSHDCLEKRSTLRLQGLWHDRVQKVEEPKSPEFQQISPI